MSNTTHSSCSTQHEYGAEPDTLSQQRSLSQTRHTLAAAHEYGTVPDTLSQ